MSRDRAARAGSGSPARGPARPAQRRVTGAPRSTSRRELGEVYMRSLLRSPAAARARRPGRARGPASAACRCCSRSCPGLADVAGPRDAAAVAAARRSRSTRCCRASAGSTCGGRAQRGGLHRPRGAVTVSTSARRGRRGRCWSRSRPWRSAPAGCASRRTTCDFFVASRVVGPGLNAAAISGEYLSAASFLGVAGLVLAYGADMLWYPVGFTAGYLVLLVFVAAPLRRSGAYTLPDFAEARLESRRGAPRSRRCSSSRSAGSTWCRSSRAPG